MSEPATNPTTDPRAGLDWDDPPTAAERNGHPTDGKLRLTPKGEARLAEIRWAHQQLVHDRFAEYRGEYVAVSGQRVRGTGRTRSTCGTGWSGTRGWTRTTSTSCTSRTSSADRVRAAWSACAGAID